MVVEGGGALAPVRGRVPGELGGGLDLLGAAQQPPVVASRLLLSLLGGEGLGAGAAAFAAGLEDQGDGGRAFAAGARVGGGPQALVVGAGAGEVQGGLEGPLGGALAGELAPGAVGGELGDQGAGAFVLPVAFHPEQRDVRAGVGEDQVGEQGAAAGQLVLDLSGERLQVADARRGEQAGCGDDVESVLGVRGGGLLALRAGRGEFRPGREQCGGVAAAGRGSGTRVCGRRGGSVPRGPSRPRPGRPGRRAPSGHHAVSAPPAAAAPGPWPAGTARAPPGPSRVPARSILSSSAFLCCLRQQRKKGCRHGPPPLPWGPDLRFCECSAMGAWKWGRGWPWGWRRGGCPGPVGPGPGGGRRPGRRRRRQARRGWWTSGRPSARNGRSGRGGQPRAGTQVRPTMHTAPLSSIWPHPLTTMLSRPDCPGQEPCPPGLSVTGITASRTGQRSWTWA